MKRMFFTALTFWTGYGLGIFMASIAWKRAIKEVFASKGYKI